MVFRWLRGLFSGETPQPAAAPGAAASEPVAAPDFPPWEPEQETKANLAVAHLQQNLLEMMKSEKGVHAETLMAVIGAIAGHAVIHAIVEDQVKTGRLPQGAQLMEARTADGRKYYFGDHLNGYLIPEGRQPYPLWTVVSSAALAAGVPQAELPKIDALFAHVTATIGTPEFGKLRPIEGHDTAWPPLECLMAFWPVARKLFAYTFPGSPEDQPLAVRHWPMVAAIVAQHYVAMTKDILDPRLAVLIFMESAVAMSKVDPETVPQEMPTTPEPGKQG